MILAVDVGNTETHIGLFRGDELARDWRVETRPIGTADDCVRSIGDLLRSAETNPEDFTGIVLGSVVPTATVSLEGMARRWLGRDPVVVVSELRMPIEICTKDPKQVGADRIANAVAGCAKQDPPFIVVDLGTATTFDVIAGGGRYLGGVICPGVMTSLSDLVRRTAKLPSVDLRTPPRVIGTDTEECMQSGIVFGSAEEIDGIVRRIREEMGENCPAIATGGLAPAIIPHCRNVSEIDPHLTLRGLKILHDLNAAG